MIDLLIAVLLDLIIGDPQGYPHPVRLFGSIIKGQERLVRRIFSSKRGLNFGGLVIVGLNMSLAFFIPFYILIIVKGYSNSSGNGILFHLLNIYMMYSAIAARCLRDEGVKIYKALNIGIDEARVKLSYIVGRDTKDLEESEVIRATIETIAENTSDGVIAPLLFAMIGGAPFAYLYKMVNTMDSMLGYLNDKYKYIGYFPAKTDDIFNYIPARLTAILMNLSCFIKYNGINGWRIMLRDRRNHKSPNCGYPEGAVAGLLEVQLGGDNYYFGEIMKKPRIGNALKPLEKLDIKRSIEVMFRTEILIVLIYIIIEVIL